MARTTWKDHFIYGGAAFGTAAASNTPWRVTETGASTVWTAGLDNGTSAGIGHLARIGHSSATEIQNICLSFGDVLQHSIADELIMEGRIRLGQSALDTATSLVFGLAGDRNDVLDTVAQNCWFRMEGGTSTTAVYFESDDGTTDTDDQVTSLTLTTGWKKFKIDARNKAAIRMHFADANGVLIPMGTTLNMSAYAGCLQPYFQIQKTSDNNVDYMDIDYVSLSWEEG